MADDSILVNKLMESVVLSGEKDVINNYMRILRINGTDIIGGYIVTESGEGTDYDIDLCAGGEAVGGVVLGYNDPNDVKEDYSLGITIGDNKLANVMRKTGGRVRVQVLLRRTDTVSALIAVGDAIYASVTTAGLASSIGPTTQANDMMRFLGYSDIEVGVAITALKVIPIWM